MDMRNVNKIMCGGSEILKVMNGGVAVWQSIPPYDDKWTNVGSLDLIAGDMDFGYFGTATTTQFMTGSALALAIGLSAGTVINDTEPWLKWVENGVIKFTAKKTFRHKLSWNDINAVGAVAGTATVTHNNLTYKVRLLTGNAGGEWEKIMYGVHVNQLPNWETFSDADIGIGNGNGLWTLCQEVHSANSWRVRGYNGITNISQTGSLTADQSHAFFGWRPVLELVV